jgi:hypothetical protein
MHGPLLEVPGVGSPCPAGPGATGGDNMSETGRLQWPDTGTNTGKQPEYIYGGMVWTKVKSR